SSNPEITKLAENFTGSKITATDFLKSVLNYSLWFSQAHIFVDYSLKKNHLVSLIELSEIRDYEYDENGELIYLRCRTEEQVRNGFKVEKYKVIKEYKKENGKVYWNDYVSQNINGLQTTNNLNYEARNVNQIFGLDRIPLVSFYPIATLEKFNPDIIFKN